MFRKMNSVRRDTKPSPENILKIHFALIHKVTAVGEGRGVAEEDDGLTQAVKQAIRVRANQVLPGKWRVLTCESLNIANYES